MRQELREQLVRRAPQVRQVVQELPAVAAVRDQPEQQVRLDYVVITVQREALVLPEKSDRQDLQEELELPDPADLLAPLVLPEARGP